MDECDWPGAEQNCSRRRFGRRYEIGPTARCGQGACKSRLDLRGMRVVECRESQLADGRRPRKGADNKLYEAGNDAAENNPDHDMSPLM